MDLERQTLPFSVHDVEKDIDINISLRTVEHVYLYMIL